MDKSKYLIVIVGPTAVGKTALSIQLAHHFDTEILSADSRQIFKELTIGTAKPSDEEMEGIKHHFINSHSIQEDYNAGKFEGDALNCLKEIFAKKDVAMVVGGSGLYIKALCEGMDELPEGKPEIREELNKRFAEEGLSGLLADLKVKDPGYYEIVDKANPQRIIRALEVIESSGKAFSSQRSKNKKERSFQIVKIGLEMDREILYNRIDLRMEKMLEEGLFEEAKEVYEFKDYNALKTVGYEEIFEFLEGKYDWEEMVRLLKRNSRRYAKRQLTWFKKDKDIRWFQANEYEGIKEFIAGEIRLKNNIQ